MDSTRQQKFSRLIQKEIGDQFQKDGYNYYGKAFVTVMGAKVSPDLGVAKIYISVFGVKDTKEVLTMIEKHTKEIRRKLGESIRHQARIIPELKFFIDDSLDYVDKIEKLLKETKKDEEKE
jgi:ribosome-binding factor A